MERDYADNYGRLERDHWWFRARREILRDLLARELPWPAGARVLEIGVGPGLNLYSLYPQDIRLEGMEPDANNVEVARRRGPVPVHCGTVESLPEPVRASRYHAITLFDVLEHLEDDERALAILRERLEPGGYLVLSVPAYMFLWGLQDEVSHHYRRYTRGALVRQLKQAGFRVLRATYFNSLLFPFIALFRVLGRAFPAGKRKAQSDFDYNAGVVNSLCCGIFALERPLLRRMNFPAGVSLFVAAQRTPDDATGRGRATMSE